MIKLQTAALKDFARRTQYIVRDSTKPVLSNLLLTHKDGAWLLTKNNLKAVCISVIPGEGDPQDVLLEEDLFMKMVTGSNSEFIKIAVRDQRVTISDDDGPVTIPITDPVDHFPVAQEPPEGAEVIPMTKGIMESLKIASKFIMDNEAAMNYRFVIMDRQFITGFHTNYFYLNSGFKDLPLTFLTPDNINVLYGAGELTFNQTDNHYFFYSSGSTYIFTKPEEKNRRVDQVEELVKAPGASFTVKKEDFIACLNRAIMVSKSELVPANFSAEGKQLRMGFIDASYARETEKFVPFTGELDSITLDSKLILESIKAIPYETLSCKTVRNALIIEGGNEWFAFVGSQKS